MDVNSQGTPQGLIEQLQSAVERIDTDDLSTLAKMHGWCERLAAESRGSNAPLAGQAADLANQLGELILGEATNAQEALSTIVKAIASLGGTAPETPGEPVTNTASAPADDVEAQLAKVFDEDVPDEASALEPPADDTPAPSAESDAAPPTEPAPSEPDDSPAAEAEPAYQSEPLLIDPKETEFVKAFVDEASEHLETIEAAVLEVERQPADTEKINDLFRPFHTIKGMAGFLHLRDINCLTHEVETLLDQGRKGKRTVTPALIDLVFAVVDILKTQIASISEYLGNPTGEPVPQPPVEQMISRLRDVVAGRLELESDPPVGGGSGQRVGENLVAQRVVPQEVVDHALSVQQKNPEKKVGEILVDQGVATTKQVSQAIRAQTGAGSSSTASSTSTKYSADQSIRIDTEKLDALVDMVGELVIAQTMVNASELIRDDPKLNKDVSQVTKIVRDVQELAMAMRMVPIGATFQKMARLVRDVSRKAGKQVELSIAGEETELDKNVIQAIGDPLVHMVRNAVDHGIETPETRAADGKPELGRVHLEARHQGGNIVIEISDDGRGLDPDKLVAKAVERGLIQPGTELNEQEAFQLILAPGFSTAEKVTDISGRGVGMDVVKRNIEKLRGKVEISSEKGRGSKFAIRLPLTLAIIDGMVVTVAGERFIIPTITIEQSLRPTPEMITTVQQKGEMLNVRGRLIPLIQMGQLFGLTGRIDPCDTMVVIAHCEGREIGLVLHELIGQQQVVIKTLGEQFKDLKGISGAAILGDGRVGLILEMTGLAELHQKYVKLTGRKRPGSPPVATPASETATDGDAPACARPADETAPVLEPAFS